MEFKRKEAYTIAAEITQVKKKGGNTEKIFDDRVIPFIKEVFVWLLIVAGSAVLTVAALSLIYSGAIGLIIFVTGVAVLCVAANRQERKVQAVIDEMDESLIAIDKAIIEYKDDPRKLQALQILRHDMVRKRNSYAASKGQIGYRSNNLSGEYVLEFEESKNIYVKNMRLANKKFKIGESLGKQEPSIDDVKGLVIQKVTEEVSSDSSKDISEESIKIVILVTVTIMNIFCELNILTKKEFYKRVVGA
jgi:hypothetical protein